MDSKPHADAGPGALRIFTAGATREGFSSIADAFARDTGITLHIATTHGHDIRDAILTGEADADVVSLPLHMIDALQDAGLVAADPAPEDPDRRCRPGGPAPARRFRHGSVAPYLA